MLLVVGAAAFVPAAILANRYSLWLLAVAGVIADVLLSPWWLLLTATTIAAIITQSCWARPIRIPSGPRM